MKFFLWVFACNFRQIIIFFSRLTIGSWWSQWGVTAASHSYSWLKWCSLGCCVSWFGLTDTIVTFKTLLWSFLCNLIDMSMYWKYPLCRPLYAFGSNACIQRDKLKWNEVTLKSLLLLEWVLRILLTFLIGYVSWVLANIVTKSSHCFCKCNKTEDPDSGQWFVQILGILLYTYLHPLLGADKAVGGHCYLW